MCMTIPFVSAPLLGGEVEVVPDEPKDEGEEGPSHKPVPLPLSQAEARALKLLPPPRSRPCRDDLVGFET